MGVITFYYSEQFLAFFIIELVFLFILLIVLFFKRFTIVVGGKEKERFEKKISKQIVESLLSGAPIQIDKKKWKSWEISMFLTTLERFDQRFLGDSWNKIKEKLLDQYFLTNARLWVNKRSWVKRNFSARIFALHPKPKDIDAILRLMDDPVFLVRRAAIRAAIKSHNKDVFLEVIKRMSQEEGYPYIFYRDLLIRGSEQTLKWIEEFSLSESVQIHLVCLDILSSAFIELSRLPLEIEFHTSGQKTRLGIAKIYAHNLQPTSPQILLEALEDSDAEVRAVAALGLENFATPEIFGKLTSALRDENLKVRTNAALSLKEMGKHGMSILMLQEPSKDGIAYEAAQYALKFR